MRRAALLGFFWGGGGSNYILQKQYSWHLGLKRVSICCNFYSSLVETMLVTPIILPRTLGLTQHTFHSV